MTREFKVIDLFAGPGGLGEGFSVFGRTKGDRPFRIALSVEKEVSAHRTLELRAFYRQFPQGEAPKEYYEYLAGKRGQYPEDDLFALSQYRKEISAARHEARQLELGKDNRAINLAIEQALGLRPGHWVLIGGPPCQAYSLVGRSRNRGNKNYKPEEDNRNYLYREYLKVISRFRPAVFVMENVKGMLSANVDGERIFQRILGDLQCPARALHSTESRTEYVIIPVASESHSGNLFGVPTDPADFVVRAENFGVPQARHRVILFGIRGDLVAGATDILLRPSSAAPTVRDVIGDLPHLRSGLSKEDDSFAAWAQAIRSGSDRAITAIKKLGISAVARKMAETISQIAKTELMRGSNWSTTTTNDSRHPTALRRWYRDESGWRGVCNHETRGHIREDLHRYLFCACYGAVQQNGRNGSPTSHEFPAILAPKHTNWHTGHFSDRYRVQLADRPGTTVTSHISKDGHYFIHYDPVQCRSLTVREAARIQTFPDNYFFVGNRTEQYVQVGNAVPPYLAEKIAGAVLRILTVR
jgi:DNA (cytosine-5)-methyltransferase 1